MVAVPEGENSMGPRPHVPVGAQGEAMGVTVK